MIKCTRCKNELPDEEFKIKRNGQYQKRCIQCNNYQSKWYKQKYINKNTCKTCNQVIKLKN